MDKELRVAVEKNVDYLVELLQKMVRFASYSGEAEEIQLFLQEKFNELGLETELFKVQPQKLEKYKGFSYDGFSYDRRYSLTGLKKGKPIAGRSGRLGRSLILNGHIDIVPPGDLEKWESHPLSGKYEDGKIFGRGALDMKGGLAAGITAVKTLIDLGLRHSGDITIASVCGEETGGCGAFALVEHGLRADGCLILEPTQLKICHIQSGCHTFKITVRGRSIHACMAHKGINAVDKFNLIYEALQDMDRRRHARFAREAPDLLPFYENPQNIAPFNLGLLKAGDWPSSVPDLLEAHGRIGIFPGESVEEMHREFEEAVYAAAAADPWLSENQPSVEWYEGLFEPAQVSANHPLISTLSLSHQQVFGEKAGFEAATYGSDMRIFNNYGAIPTILYGPGDVSLAHTVNESIRIEELIDAASVIVRMLINWCGAAKL